MPLPEARKAGTMMDPTLRVFDPHSGTTNVFEVHKGSLRRKETVIEDMAERPRPPASHQNVINTRSGRPTSPQQKTHYKPHHSSHSLKSLASVSPFLFKTNPFPLHNSASRKLGIGSHSEWDLAKTQRDKSLPDVDPVQLGRTSPIRNFYGKETISQHKPTVRFSSTGVPLFEVCITPPPFQSIHHLLNVPNLNPVSYITIHLIIPHSSSSFHNPSHRVPHSRIKNGGKNLLLLLVNSPQKLKHD